MNTDNNVKVTQKSKLKVKVKQSLTNFRKKITVAYIAKVALLTALSYVLYLVAKFPLPMMFPSFLDMQFSELPAMLAGFSLGPTAGVIVIVLKCLLKFPFSGTMFVGEIMDIVIGIAYVLPASIIYYKNKTKKHALIGLGIGIACGTLVAMLFNYAVAIPMYVQLLFNGNFSILINMCAPLYPSITESNFYLFYIFVAILPFNLLRLLVVSLVTFVAYKRLSKLLHWEVKKKQTIVSNEIEVEVNQESDVSTSSDVKTEIEETKNSQESD